MKIDVDLWFCRCDFIIGSDENLKKNYDRFHFRIL